MPYCCLVMHTVHSVSDNKNITIIYTNMPQSALYLAKITLFLAQGIRDKYDHNMPNKFSHIIAQLLLNNVLIRIATCAAESISASSEILQSFLANEEIHNWCSLDTLTLNWVGALSSD